MKTILYINSNHIKKKSDPFGPRGEFTRIVLLQSTCLTVVWITRTSTPMVVASSPGKLWSDGQRHICQYTPCDQTSKYALSVSNINKQEKNVVNWGLLYRLLIFGAFDLTNEFVYPSTFQNVPSQWTMHCFPYLMQHSWFYLY